MHSVMDIIAESFAEIGYNIMTDSEYQSIIKGGLNYYDVNITLDRPYISKKFDILIALNAENLDANIDKISENGIVFCSQKTL